MVESPASSPIFWTGLTRFTGFTSDLWQKPILLSLETRLSMLESPASSPIFWTGLTRLTGFASDLWQKPILLSLLILSLLFRLTQDFVLAQKFSLLGAGVGWSLSARSF
jgi:hypothetical protein